MANNKAIQILRTNEITDNNKGVALLDGQPFYNKQKNYLTIGNGTKKANGLPITVPTVEGWFDDIDQPNSTQTEKYLANVGGNATDANKYYIKPSRHYSNEQSIVDMLEIHSPEILLDTDTSNGSTISISGHGSDDEKLIQLKANSSNLINISSEKGISLVADGESDGDYRLKLKSPLIQFESGGDDDYLQVEIGKEVNVDGSEEYAMYINCATTIEGRTEIEGHTSIKGSTLIAGSSIDLKSNIGDEPAASISLSESDGQIYMNSISTQINGSNTVAVTGESIILKTPGDSPVAKISLIDGTIYDSIQIKAPKIHLKDDNGDDVIGVNTDTTYKVSIAGTTSITDATDSTGKDSGALKVSGGVGVAKSLYAEGNIVASGTNSYISASGGNSYIKATKFTSDGTLHMRAEKSNELNFDVATNNTRLLFNYRKPSSDSNAASIIRFCNGQAFTGDTTTNAGLGSIECDRVTCSDKVTLQYDTSSNALKFVFI